jgi:hypothetical protein
MISSSFQHTYGQIKKDINGTNQNNGHYSTKTTLAHEFNTWYLITES